MVLSVQLLSPESPQTFKNSKVPDLPIFILTEIRNNLSPLIGKLPIAEMVNNCVFLRQLNQGQFGDRNLANCNKHSGVDRISIYCTANYLGSMVIDEM
ncbi:hypothetical protein [Flavobacterium sp. 2]|uniref:hypothetical protein n=1 Tax=Flavobacterium sp. 2 TaxID=308053 RepID=UPI003CF532E5